jgi:polyhydroxyalkanoate synthesis regulator phasin
MIDVLKKTIYTGVGLACLTKGKSVELAQSFKDNFKLSNEEGEKLAKELFDHSQKASDELNERISKAFATLLEKAEIARQSEVSELKERIKVLEEKLKSTENS